MSQKTYKVPEDFAALAHLRLADYQRLYQESVRDPNSFWARIGRRLDWIQPFAKVKDVRIQDSTTAKVGNQPVQDVVMECAGPSVIGPVKLRWSRV